MNTCRGRDLIFTHFRSGTPARHQVTLVHALFLQRPSNPFHDTASTSSLLVPSFAIIREWIGATRTPGELRLHSACFFSNKKQRGMEPIEMHCFIIKSNVRIFSESPTNRKHKKQPTLTASRIENSSQWHSAYTLVNSRQNRKDTAPQLHLVTASLIAFFKR